VLILAGLLVLASVASAIRSQAGLPALIGAVLVLWRRPWSWTGRGAAIVLCLVAYLSVSTFGMAAARAERDHQLGDRPLLGNAGRHPFWHTAYIGYGYLPNDWDIHYFDDIAYRDVLRENPRAKFLGPAYGRILRERYFKLVRENPGYTVKVYAAKLLVALRPATPALLALAVLAPWLLFVDARRRRWRRDAVFLVMAGLVALGSPLLATPFSAYLLGWLGAVLLAAILAIAATLSDWSAAWTYARSLVSRAALSDRSRRRVVGVVAVGLAILAVIVVTAPGVEHRALEWNATPPPPVKQPANATE
jgi:hypothetical protein